MTLSTITYVSLGLAGSLAALAVSLELTPQHLLFIVVGLLALLGGKNAVVGFLRLKDMAMQIAADPHVHSPELKSRTTEGKIQEAISKKLDKVLEQASELRTGFEALKDYVRQEMTALRAELATTQNDIDALGEELEQVKRQLTATQGLVRRHGIDLPKEIT